MLLHCTAAREAPLESLLRRELSMSSSLISRLKWQSALLVNGAPVHTNHPVRPGDEITVRIEESVEGFDPEPLALRVLYEDEALIALDKPPGMLTHPSPCRNEGTLANGLLYHYLQTGQRCGIHPVSRLDRDTFGIVLFAKSAYIHEKFRCLHREGSIRNASPLAFPFSATRSTRPTPRAPFPCSAVLRRSSCALWSWHSPTRSQMHPSASPRSSASAARRHRRASFSMQPKVEIRNLSVIQPSVVLFFANSTDFLLIF